MPRYLGPCEAGIGSMKARTHRQAVAKGRPGGLDLREDAEAARSQANSTVRPWGVSGPTPAEVWAGRPPIQPGERSAFLAAVSRAEQDAHWSIPNARLAIARSCTLSSWESYCIHPQSS